MFDTDKIQRMTAELQQFALKYDDFYVIPEKAFAEEDSALFKRLKMKIRAIIFDGSSGKELSGVPVVDMAEIYQSFNERTAFIMLMEKPLPLIQTTIDVKIPGGKRIIPAFIISFEEVIYIYDRVLFLKYIDMYVEDGLKSVKSKDLPERFARGLTTNIHPHYANFKMQFFDSRQHKPRHDFSDAAIVIQGPIAYDNNYTVETFKLYREIYPNAPIVVSTWKNEATKDFRRVCRENLIVLLENEPPEIRAPGNVNMQLKSSFQGVKFVRENTSSKFVLKTRTDQRIGYFNFLVYFKNLLKTFPPRGDKLHERIIFFGSHNTHIVFPLSYHDFLAFGRVEDIYKLYDIPFHGERGKLDYYKKHVKKFGYIGHLLNKFDYSLVTEQSHKLFKLNRMLNRVWWPETYLNRTFYEKYIAPVDPTKLFETSWKFIADYLIFVDFNTLQLDWPKYEKMRYNPKFAYGGQDAFARWLDMYRNFKIDWV